MKIIKKGKMPKTTERFTCSNCGCVFECEANEYNITFDQKDGNYADVVCPTCGKRVYKDLIVKDIRKHYVPGDKNFGAKALSKRFRVAPQTISAVNSGQNWRD